jgi:Protein of unknown function DUF262.
MKVNKELVKAAEFNPTKNTKQMTIIDMCRMIEKEEVSLPLYQRDISWTLEKSIALFNYQLIGKAPVSPISMNIIKNLDNYVPQVSFINREIVQIMRGQYSVADGQQRLTTNYRAYINDEEFRSVALDISIGKFTLVNGRIKDNQIPVGVLFNKEDIIFFDFVNASKYLKEDMVKNLLLKIRSKIQQYSYTINLAEDLTEDEQIEWFEVLNNAGSRVSILQMRFSKLKAHGIDIYVQYTSKFKNKLIDLDYDFFSPQKTGVSYPIAALNSAYEVVTGKLHTDGYAPIPSDTKENQLCSLEPDDLVKCFALTLEALDKTLHFIEDNSLPDPDRIDYINYLTGYFVFNPGNIDQNTKEALIDWYNNIDFINLSNSKRRTEFSKLLKI